MTAAAKESDKEMRRFKERVDQDFEFREAQLVARYQQMVKQGEVDMDQEQEAFIQDQSKQFDDNLQKEVTRLQDEQARNHSLLTQSIFEDVNRTVRDEQKRRFL